MERRSFCISLRELPARSRRLGGDEMSGIFGGCGEDNVACEKDSDCCAFYVCRRDKRCHPLDTTSGP